MRVVARNYARQRVPFMSRLPAGNGSPPILHLDDRKDLPLFG
jgi:hypothetical protein